MCRLLKRRILKLITDIGKGTDVETTAKLVYLSIRQQGVGIIDSFVLDRGPQ
jgi:hypothetical protein